MVKISICQFPVCGDLRKNAAFIKAQISEAAQQNTRLAFFPEAALSGYVGTDLHSFEGFDWDAYLEEMHDITRLCKKLGIYAVYGGAHRLTSPNKPHNSLYVASDTGEIIARYDKRFCTNVDLQHYSAGDRFVCFTIDGVKFGLLICYDIRFPELYREYKKLEVDVVLHAFYNARAQTPETIHTVIMHPSLQASAASNYVWVAATNATGEHQSWPSIGIYPDGTIACTLEKGATGITPFTIDPSEKRYDASAPYRPRALQGVLSSEDAPIDPRRDELV